MQDVPPEIEVMEAAADDAEAVDPLENLQVTCQPEIEVMDAPADSMDMADPLENMQATCRPEPPPGRNMDIVMKIPVSVDVMLGSANMPVSRLMKLGRGSVVALDRKVGEPIDVVVNGRVIARGEVVLLEDGSSRFGISLTEIVNVASSQTVSGDDEA